LVLEWYDVQAYPTTTRFSEELGLYFGCDRRVGDELAGLLRGVLRLDLRVVSRILGRDLGVVCRVIDLVTRRVDPALGVAPGRLRGGADDDVVDDVVHARWSGAR
jgi:hypothetical protein